MRLIAVLACSRPLSPFRAPRRSTSPGTVTVTSGSLRHTHVDLGTKGKSVGDVDVSTPR